MKPSDVVVKTLPFDLREVEDEDEQRWITANVGELGIYGITIPQHRCKRWTSEEHGMWLDIGRWEPRSLEEAVELCQQHFNNLIMQQLEVK